MKLPKKITPDRIRESLVQVYFKTNIPFVPLVGYVHKILKDLGFAYVNPVIKSPTDIPVTGNPNLFEALNIFPQHLFVTEEVKLQLHENGSLIFNCMNNSYVGWEKYQEHISKVISNLHTHQIVQGFNRIGVRYISEFSHNEILENLNFTFNFTGLNKPLKNGNFRMEWDDEPHRIILGLGSNLNILPINNKNDTKTNYISLVDIDVIRENFEISSPVELLKMIGQSHEKEKEIFFSLLKEDFLKTLNPIY